MKVGKLEQWFFGAIAILIMGFAAIAASVVLAIPVAIVAGIIYWIRWKAQQPPIPPPMPQVIQAAEERTIAANFPDTLEFRKSYIRRIMEAWDHQLPPWPLFERMMEFAEGIYELEGLNNPLPPLHSSDPIEHGRYRDELGQHMKKISDAPYTLGIFSDALTRSLKSMRDALPKTVLKSREELQESIDAPPAAFTVPLVDYLEDVPNLTYDVAIAFYTDEIKDLGLFQTLKRQLDENDYTASGRNGSYVRPWDYKGSRREIINAYLRDTHLIDLFDVDVPFTLPEETRFSGHWILSPPGRGKTTLLHAMVMEDLRKPGASLILMDSKGDLIDPIRRLKEFQDRLIVIDPDPKNPVAINPLDIAHADLAQTVDLLEYLFASLLEFKMTAMQTTLFRSVLRSLVSVFPNPTLETFRDLLTNGYEKYKEYIDKLPPDLKDFFYRDFNEKGYSDRRREVLQRLRLLLDNDTMRAMLTATATRFRISEAMDTGKIVIINNSKARLGDQGAEFFGRFFIAQVLAAAQQRSSRRRDKKPPVYFYIDECQNVIARDEKIPTILDECRSQNIALIMAHQRTRQITSENVLDALSNCAIRFANSDEEARYLAPRLRTSPEFLQRLPVGRFAAYVRDMIGEAIALTVNRVSFDDHALITAAEGRQLQERMRTEYGLPRQLAPASDIPSGYSEEPVEPASADTAAAVGNGEIKAARPDEPASEQPSAASSNRSQTEGAAHWS